MVDVNQLNLKEPERMDWDNYHEGSTWMRPPVPVGPDGKFLTYTGQVKGVDFDATDEGELVILADPIVLVQNNSDVDGYEIRFTRASTRKFQKNGKPLDASMAGNLLRSAGVQAKPQRNAEYIAAAKAIVGRKLTFSLDWRAYDEDTQERIVGYENFPDDPERPGQKKVIMNAGDMVQLTDNRGNPDGPPKPLTADVLFANARVRFFNTPRTRK